MVVKSPTADEQRWLDQLRSIARARLRDQPVDLWLFGSRARGTWRPRSDVDLAVDPRGPIAPDLVPLLREDFEESSVPWKVDVVDLSTVGADFRGRVLAEGVAWITCGSS